jgi:hypothetical protein
MGYRANKNHERKILTTFSGTNIKNASCLSFMGLCLSNSLLHRCIPPFSFKKQYQIFILMNTTFTVNALLGSLPSNTEHRLNPYMPIASPVYKLALPKLIYE